MPNIFQKKKLLIADPNLEGAVIKPGMLKLEWSCCTSSWKYIFIGPQHYVLKVTDGCSSSSSNSFGQLKTVGLSRLSSNKAFHYAYLIMFGSKPTIVSIPQERRIIKLQSMVTQIVNLTFSSQGLLLEQQAAASAATL